MGNTRFFPKWGWKLRYRKVRRDYTGRIISRNIVEHATYFKSPSMLLIWQEANKHKIEVLRYG